MKRNKMSLVSVVKTQGRVASPNGKPSTYEVYTSRQPITNGDDA